MTEQGTGLKVCYEDTDGSPCYVYDNFKLSPTGEVASFAIDKRPLAGRLAIGDNTVKTSPLGDITFLSAYTSQSGYLIVSTSVRTKSEPIYVHDEAPSRPRTLTPVGTVVEETVDR